MQRLVMAHEPKWFNDDANFKNVLQHALELKQACMSDDPRTFVLEGFEGSLRVSTSFELCQALHSFSMNGCTQLTALPKSLCLCEQLRKLDLGPFLTTEGYLVGNTKLESLPECMGSLRLLEVLILDYCEALKVLPQSLADCTMLNKLSVNGCYNLRSLPDLQNLELEVKYEGVIVVKWWETAGRKAFHLRDMHFMTLLPESENMSLPALDACTQLAVLKTSGCKSVDTLPPSVGGCAALITLEMNQCTSLVGLPESLGDCKALRTLNMEGCSSLRALPESMGGCVSLRVLDLESTGLQTLPAGMGDCVALESLEMTGCEQLSTLPPSLFLCPRLKRLFLNGARLLTALPHTMQHASALEIVQLGDCTQLQELPPILPTSLVELDIRQCAALSSIPDSIGACSQLSSLVMLGCTLISLPESLGECIALHTLNASGMKSLAALPDNVHWRSLEVLQLSECGELTRLPASLGECVALKKIECYWCKSLRELPPSIGNCGLLVSLDLRQCSALSSLPASIRECESLQEVDVYKCAALKAIPMMGEAVVSIDAYGCTQLTHVADLLAGGGCPNLRGGSVDLRGCGSLQELPITLRQQRRPAHDAEEEQCVAILNHSQVRQPIADCV